MHAKLSVEARTSHLAPSCYLLQGSGPLRQQLQAASLKTKGWSWRSVTATVGAQFIGASAVYECVCLHLRLHASKHWYVCNVERIHVLFLLLYSLPECIQTPCHRSQIGQAIHVQDWHVCRAVSRPQYTCNSSCGSSCLVMYVPLVYCQVRGQLSKGNGLWRSIHETVVWQRLSEPREPPLSIYTHAPLSLSLSHTHTFSLAVRMS